jgi:hypothetical protein
MNYLKLNYSILFRTSANKIGFGKIAEKIREHNFHALLLIGGYEVNKKT